MCEKINVSIVTKSLNVIRMFFLIILALFVTECGKDKEPPTIPTGRTKSYTILNTNLSDMTGTVTFIENENNSTTIDFNLDNTKAEVDNVLYLRRQTANIGGDLAAILNPLNGTTGTSSTLISKLSDGQKITYQQFLNFNGYIAIEVTGQNTGELAAYSDIGPNEPTGNQIVYTLLSPVDGDFEGLVTIKERKKGTSSLRITLKQYSENSSYPAKLRNSEAGSLNEILLEFPPIEGKFNGNSFYEFDEINGKLIAFEELLELNAFIEVNSDLDSNLVIARGGIGSNPDALER